MTIGFGDVTIFDKNKERTVWNVSGKVLFMGKAHVGHGSRISVSNDAELQFGDNFACTAKTSIICASNIVFGNDVLISWETLIMDTDFHFIRHSREDIKNNYSPIKIGNHVWVGCRSTILKGVEIGNDSVIAAGSVVSKSFPFDNILVGGAPAIIRSKDVEWYESLQIVQTK